MSIPPNANVYVCDLKRRTPIPANRDEPLSPEWALVGLLDQALTPWTRTVTFTTHEAARWSESVRLAVETDNERWISMRSTTPISAGPHASAGCESWSARVQPNSKSALWEIHRSEDA